MKGLHMSTVNSFLAAAVPLARSTSQERGHHLHMNEGNMYPRNRNATSEGPRAEVQAGGHILDAWLPDPVTSTALPAGCPRPSLPTGTPLPSITSPLQRPETLRYVPALARPPPRAYYTPNDGSSMQTTQQMGERAADSSSYDAGIEAAIQHLKHFMYGGRGPRNRPSQKPLEFVEQDRDFPYAADASLLSGLENLGRASSGHPTAAFPGRHEPMFSALEGNLFPQSSGPWNGMPVNPAVIQASVSDFSYCADAWVAETQEKSRRAEQRRAEANFALYKKRNDGSKFKIRTDAAGNIVTNKLRVTSMMKKLMEIYLDVAQIHYNDNDDRFVLVENIVRSCFEFEPPIKETWFKEYMRKKLEKSRCEFRKHFEATGQMHPDCPPHKHLPLLAWWSSPLGSSRSSRMKEMNSSRVNERLANDVGVNPNIPCGFWGTELNNMSRMSTPTLPVLSGLDKSNSAGASEFQNLEVDMPESVNELGIPELGLDGAPNRPKKGELSESAPKSRECGSDDPGDDSDPEDEKVIKLKKHLDDIVRGLNKYDELTAVMDQVQSLLSDRGDVTISASVHLVPTSRMNNSTTDKSVSPKCTAGTKGVENMGDSPSEKGNSLLPRKRGLSVTASREEANLEEMIGSGNDITVGESPITSPDNTSGVLVETGDAEAIKKRKKCSTPKVKSPTTTTAQKARLDVVTRKKLQLSPKNLSLPVADVPAQGSILGTVSDVQVPKKTSKFDEREPPAQLTPKGQQVTYQYSQVIIY
ncbi:hypothetical protein KC19_11G055900 [Ceratodon purpureus]|uniref:Uncharacterized protein n=1 Tax=Ceratodon purpureus TaxID=3225 RepID=A0A8T0GH24_CERPU|nr:hypothetical protein KC19_11G055900 [Ceratodon purpureus]KAG0556472.1 hypothetical protein KC19_11G055900 [Ceratodon purpureus]